MLVYVSQFFLSFAIDIDLYLLLRFFAGVFFFQTVVDLIYFIFERYKSSTYTIAKKNQIYTIVLFFFGFLILLCYFVKCHISIY